MLLGSLSCGSSCLRNDPEEIRRLWVESGDVCGPGEARHHLDGAKFRPGRASEIWAFHLDVKACKYTENLKICCVLS